MEQSNRDFDIETVARAIEADAGQDLAELRQALAEVKAGIGTHCRITTPQQMLVRGTRNTLGLSQVEFATRINTPVATLRDWEQGRFTPPGAVLCLLRLLHSHPHLGEELVSV